MANYEEVVAKVSASNKEDWLVNHDQTQRTYKGDLNIRILTVTEEVLGREVAFEEPWVQQAPFPDPKSRIEVFAIYYASSFVRYVHTVEVDAGRAYIPHPKSAADLVISRWAYRFGLIIQPPHDRLDEYLELVGIRVK